jgi:hypothetical protein
LDRLRDLEIYNMQLLVEREVNAMVSLSGQREQEGKAGKSTRQLTYRLTATRKKIHDLMSAWMALHTLGKPGAAPPIYEEEDVLANILPWQPTSGRSGMVTQQQLELSAASQELRQSPLFLLG